MRKLPGEVTLGDPATNRQSLYLYLGLTAFGKKKRMKRQIKRREEDEIVMHTFDAKSSTSPFTGAKSNLRDKSFGRSRKG